MARQGLRNPYPLSLSTCIPRTHLGYTPVMTQAGRDDMTNCALKVLFLPFWWFAFKYVSSFIIDLSSSVLRSHFASSESIYHYFHHSQHIVSFNIYGVATSFLSVPWFIYGFFFFFLFRTPRVFFVFFQVWIYAFLSFDFRSGNRLPFAIVMRILFFFLSPLQLMS